MSCEHNHKCIDTRRYIDYRGRRYRCSGCGHKYSSVEFSVENRGHLEVMKTAELFNKISSLTADKRKAINALIDLLK